MDDLVAFLRARLAEDEAAARAATPGPWVAGTTSGLLVDDGVYGQGDGGSLEFACDVREASWDWKQGNVAHIARHDPARVLAEVEAVRELLRVAVAAADFAPTFTTGFAARLEGVLRRFAVAYAAHPDYRIEWVPEGSGR